MKKFAHGLNFSAVFFCLLLAAMLVFPEASLAGASRGLRLWWGKVLPALLPFFVLADILLHTGVFGYIAAGLSPLCRLLFALPGEAGAAIVLGFTSGFPTGAAVTSSLLSQGSIDIKQAERLLCFTNNSGPLFISVTVATAILQTPQAGLYLMLLHYGISLLYGIIAARGLPLPPKRAAAAADAPLNREPIGILLKNAAQKGIMQIALIGCYLVLFSLICSVLTETGIFALLGRLLAPFLRLIGLNEAAGAALGSGITEMTLGIAAAAECGLDFAHCFALCAFFLSFGGISVQAQVYAMIASHRPAFAPYLLSCLIKGIAAYSLALPLGKMLASSASAGFAALPLPFGCDIALTLLIFMLAAICGRRKCTN